MFAVPAVLAQDAPVAQRPPGLEEVTVTARRREESLQDVPIAVSAFSAERIESTGAPDITWLQQTTPNLTLQVARGSNSTLIAFIRGVGQQDPLWGFEPGVGLYVDDVYIARPQGAVLDIYDIERLEVLRGPQGTLYGRNTIGGAIKYVTRPLGDEAQARHEVHARLLRAARFHRLRRAAARRHVLARRERGRSTVATATAKTSTPARTTTARTSTRTASAPSGTRPTRSASVWPPTTSTTIRRRSTVTARPRACGLAAGEVVLDDVYDTRRGHRRRQPGDQRGRRADGRLGHQRRADVQVDHGLSRRRDRHADRLRLPARQPALDVPGTTRTTSDAGIAAAVRGRALQGVAGLYYLDASASGAFDTIARRCQPRRSRRRDSSIPKSYAAFADVSYDFTDQPARLARRALHRGREDGPVYRAELHRPRFAALRQRRRGPGLLRTELHERARRSTSSRRASASATTSPTTLTTYASYSEGFKSGGFDMRGDVVFTPDTVNGYDPENVKSYEIGLKGSAWDGRADIQRRGVLLRLHRPADHAPGADRRRAWRASSTTRAARRSRASNSKARFAFTDSFSLTYGVGWTDAEFDEYNSFTVVEPGAAAATIAVPVDLADMAVFQNTPEWNGNLSLNYAQPLGAGWGSLLAHAHGVVSRLVPHVRVREPADRPDDRLHAGRREHRVDVGKRQAARSQLVGRNLTDEEYKIGGYYTFLRRDRSATSSTASTARRGRTR